jgi:DNA polymerase-4
MPRVILHVDLDAFFAAVEQRDHAELRGRPVLVGGSARRGVVASCSYEARAFGVHSAMPMAVALRRCPQAVVVRHHMQRYVDASRGFFAILGSFSPQVEGLSLDEAYLDLTGTARLLGSPATVAAEIKRRVRSELSLVASVGVAPIKFAAKIASDIDKPDGLRLVTAEQLIAFLHPLPISRLWGVGAVTQQKLASLGLRTIGEVARYPERTLIARLGATTARQLISLACGEDPRPVEDNDAPVSIGHQETFDEDLDDKADLELTLLDQADRVAARLRRSELRACVVTLIIKYDDFRQITRRLTLADSTADGSVLARTAFELLAAVPVADEAGMKVRLAGISASGLSHRDAPRQLALDDATGDLDRGERLGAVIDRLEDRFGAQVVRRAVMVKKSK